jgi:DNA-binding MarR family transcriptional regulator
MSIGEAIKQTGFKHEHEKMVINLLFTSGWLQCRQQQFFRQYDISPEQYNVLRILRGQYPNTATVSLVQERMLDRMSNASRLIDKLKLKDLVERSECKKDRRQMDVSITEKGLKLLEEIDENREHFESLAVSITKAEAQQLNQ